MKYFILVCIIFFCSTWNCFAEEVNGKLIAQGKCPYKKHLYDCVLLKAKGVDYIVLLQGKEAVAIYELSLLKGEVKMKLIFEWGIPV